MKPRPSISTFEFLLVYPFERIANGCDCASASISDVLAYFCYVYILSHAVKR